MRVVETGCVGYCQREVFVDLVTRDGVRLSYCDLGPDTVDEFLTRCSLAGNCATGSCSASTRTRGTGTRTCRAFKDVAVLRAQTRVVLENCGVVDPASLDAALAAGGFRAAAAALRR